MKFYIHTTGCKANQWDSHVIMNRLEDAGHCAGPLADADIIVVNACAVTDGAERDLRRFMGRLGSQNIDARVILTGCHGQVYPDKNFGAQTVLGRTEKFRIEEYLGKEGSFVSPEKDSPIEKGRIRSLPKGKTRFFFKIQDGCDHFCSYCVVPLGRGRPRSRPVPEVMETLRDLARWGVKEVVLTGIEISAYRDGETGADLRAILRLMEESETPPRIRLSSVDPLYLDDEFIEIMAHSRKIAKSVHIPLQSGSDRILKKMGRNYTGDYIRETVERLVRGIEGVGIGMDVIAGFPSEDEESFAATYSLIDSLDIYYLHVFPFSARPGTPAAVMEAKVPVEVKKQRVSTLKRLDARKREEFYGRFLGSEAWIIPESKVYKGAYLRGYTENYIPVLVPYKKSLENNLVKVKIKEIQGVAVMGEVCGG